MKKYIVTILLLIILLLFVTSAVTAWFANFKSNEAKRFEANNKTLTMSNKSYRDKNGLLINTVGELRYTIDEIKYSTDSTISSLKNQVNDLGIKLKNVKNITSLEIHNQGNGVIHITGDDTIPYMDKIPMVTSLDLPTIDDGYLTMSQRILNDSLIYSYNTVDNIIIIGYKHRRMITHTGKRRFILARLISPDWQYKVSAKSMNSTTSEISVVNVHIDKRKGLDRQD